MRCRSRAKKDPLLEAVRGLQLTGARGAGFGPFGSKFGDELGPRFGGEVPRAEGGRGKVNLPPMDALTRPTDGSADFYEF